MNLLDRNEMLFQQVTHVTSDELRSIHFKGFQGMIVERMAKELAHHIIEKGQFLSVDDMKSGGKEFRLRVYVMSPDFLNELLQEYAVRYSDRKLSTL